jgi:apolipoprotein D and lipocalin family protein
MSHPPGPWLLSAACLLATAAQASPAIEQLDVARYMGRWYQVALYPNRFQTQCVSDSSAQYRLLEGGQIEVRNECRTAGGMETVVGAAKPRGSSLEGGKLRPASLQVAFVPTWLRGISAVWGAYDVVQLLEDGQISIVSEPSKEYLWVLSRQPTLSSASWDGVERWLAQKGYDLKRLQRESHTAKP